MPEARKFLSGYGLVSGRKIGGFTLKKSSTTHKAKVRWHYYIYDVTLVFENNGSLTQTLLNSLKVSNKTMKGIRNPYSCNLHSPVISSQSKENITVKMSGECKRIYKN